MGRQHVSGPASGQDQSQDSSSEFSDASDAYDKISPFANAQFEFREQGINQICNQLNQVDDPSLTEQMLKTGLKLGLAAAGGAVGAFTGGLGWVALGAIGVGFGIGGELVDAIFTNPGAPAGVEEYRTSRLNVHIAMKAREISTLRERLNQSSPDQWAQAKADYENMQQNTELQKLEADSTLDGWVNGLSGSAHGTGGIIDEGSEELNSITTGRLHLSGTVFMDDSSSTGIVVRVNTASLDGLENASLRNRYLDRKLDDIGAFCQYAFNVVDRNYRMEHSYGAVGGLGFRASESSIARQGPGNWLRALGYMTSSGEPGDGARKVLDILLSYPLRSFGVSSIDDGGMME